MQGRHQLAQDGRFGRKPQPGLLAFPQRGLLAATMSSHDLEDVSNLVNCYTFFGGHVKSKQVQNNL